jgi:hypothetical protein
MLEQVAFTLLAGLLILIVTWIFSRLTASTGMVKAWVRIRGS